MSETYIRHPRNGRSRTTFRREETHTGHPEIKVDLYNISDKVTNWYKDTRTGEDRHTGRLIVFG